MKKHGTGTVQHQGQKVKGANVTSRKGSPAKPDRSGTGTKSGSKKWLPTGKS